MPKRTVLALDVDGVLLPERCPEPVRYVYSPYANGAVSQETIDCLRIIGKTWKAYWFTSWGIDANKYFSEWLGMRLPEIPLTGDDTQPMKDLKTDSLLAWSRKHPFTRVIVLDDEVKVETPSITTIAIEGVSGLRINDLEKAHQLRKLNSWCGT